MRLRLGAPRRRLQDAVGPRAEAAGRLHAAAHARRPALGHAPAGLHLLCAGPPGRAVLPLDTCGRLLDWHVRYAAQHSTVTAYSDLSLLSEAMYCSALLYKHIFCFKSAATSHTYVGRDIHIYSLRVTCCLFVFIPVCIQVWQHL